MMPQPIKIMHVMLQINARQILLHARRPMSFAWEANHHAWVFQARPAMDYSGHQPNNSQTGFRHGSGQTKHLQEMIQTCPKSQALPTHKKECLVVLLAIEKEMEIIPTTSPFTISTNHKSLTHLQDPKLSSSMQHEAFLNLLDLQYNIA